MYDEILEHAERVVESCSLPSTRNKWQEAIDAYKIGDVLFLGFLLWQDYNLSEQTARQLGVSIAKLPEVIKLKAMLEYLGFQPTCGVD